MPEEKLNAADQEIPESIKQMVEEAEAFSAEDWLAVMKDWSEPTFNLVWSMIDRQSDPQYVKHLLETGINPERKINKIILTVILLDFGARAKLKQALAQRKASLVPPQNPEE